MNLRANVIIDPWSELHRWLWNGTGGKRYVWLSHRDPRI